jgi:hypothetical protein
MKNNTYPGRCNTYPGSDPTIAGERRKFKIDVANLRIEPEAGGLRAQQSQLAGPWKAPTTSVTPDMLHLGKCFSDESAPSALCFETSKPAATKTKARHMAGLRFP